MVDTIESSTSTTSPKRLPAWVIVLSFAILIGFMALIAWGLNRSMRGSIAIGDRVPNFSLSTFDNREIQTNQFAGKVVLVNFWASWCQPCEEEAAELQEAYQHYKPGGKVEFIGLTYVDTEPNSLAYIQKFGITYPNGPDLATKASQMFRVRGVPETFIIDQNGKLAYFKAGPFATTDEIYGVIDGILK
jgi:cytochrome c biogenesis protein CcmG, thiol:disulfide interchange protein DsbE